MALEEDMRGLAEDEERQGFSLLGTLAYGAGNIGAGTVFGLANAALPLYLSGYRFPNFAIGLLAQDRPPLAGVFQIIIGALSDKTRTRLGRRRPYILVGVPLCSAALFGLALHPPAWVMVAVLVAMTTALSVAYGPYLALLPDLAPPRQRGRVGAVQTVGNMLGQIAILFLLSQYWERQEGLVFGIVAGSLLVGFGVTVIGVREAPSDRDAHGALEPEWKGAAEYLRGLLRHREASKYMLPTLLFWGGTGSFMPFLTRFSTVELGTDESTAFLLLIVAIVTTALFTVPAGWLGDRFSKKPVLLAGLLSFGLFVLIGSQVQTVEQAMLALALTGGANAVCSALLFPLFADLIPAHRAGEFTGFGTAAWEFAQPLGAMLGGVTADVTGSLRTTLVGAGLMVLLGGALLTLVRPERAREES